MHLAIYHPEIGITAQSDQRKFRGVAHLTEHAFAAENMVNRYPVESAGQTFILPNFNRMSEALFVQVGVGRSHIGCDPRSRLARAVASSTLIDHLFKILIEGYLKMLFPNKLLHTRGYMDLFGKQDKSLMGSIP